MEPQSLMALGDGENDVEMLQVCSSQNLGGGQLFSLACPPKTNLPYTVRVVWPYGCLCQRMDGGAQKKEV